MTTPRSDRAWKETLALYARFGREVRAHARKYLRDRDAADDVAQEVFVSAFNQCKRDLVGGTERKLIGKSEDDQIAWLKTVTRNKCVDRIKAKTRERPTEDVDVVVAPAQDRPLEQAVSRDMTARLWKVLNEHLTPREREVVVLAFDQMMTNREIADLLDITIDTVRSHKQHVRDKIERIVPGIMFPEDPGDDERRIGDGL